MKRLILVGAIGLVVLLVAAVFAATLYLDALARKSVERVGADVTKVDVQVSGASLSVLSGRGELRGIRVGNPEGFQTPSAVVAESVAVEMEPSSILEDKLVLRSIRVIGPEVTFESGLQGNNLSKLLGNIRGTGPPQDQASRRKLQVNDLVVSGGRVNLAVTLLGTRSASVPLPDIHLTNLGQGPEGITSAELSERLLAVLIEAAISTATAELAKGALPGIEKVPESIGDLFKRK
jgi:uncharacterized protein involved in outer membrane biogenesis